MKAKLAMHKDKTILQALKAIKTPFAMVAFLFFFKAKEMLLLVIIILVVIIKYPQIAHFLKL